MIPSEYQLVSLIGAGRSGTALLAEHILAHHPAIAYWSEPNHIWNHGHIYRATDIRTASDATVDTKRYIRRAFQSQWEKQGRKPVLVEKTPANCLRLSFIREIFPNAKFINLIRDGRDVTLSARTEWRGGKTVEAARDLSVGHKIMDGIKVIVEQIALRDALSTVEMKQLPYYAWRAFDVIRARVLGRGALWGPRTPRLREIVADYPLLETCAIQWRECVERVLEEWPNIPEEKRMQLRYEDLLEAPDEEVRRMLNFMDLSWSDEVEKALGKIRPGNKGKWVDMLEEDEYERVMRHIGGTLRRLRYEEAGDEHYNKS